MHVCIAAVNGGCVLSSYVHIIYHMTLAESLVSLNRAGLTDQDIAEWVTSNHSPVHQTTINRLRRGAVKSVTYEVGAGIMALAARQAAKYGKQA